MNPNLTPQFEIAQGNNLPTFIMEALNSNNVVIPLGAATGITAYMKHLQTGVILTLNAEISDPDIGEITVTWGDTDTVLPGLYRVWVDIDFPTSAKPITIPTCPHGEDQFLIEVCPVP